MPRLPPLVLKIGGSVLASDAERPVLDLVMRSERRVVVVPGGGAYADAVRAEQSREGFDDRTAHRLATLAMHRTAGDLQRIAPDLMTVATLDEARQALEAGKKCIWLPWPMIEHEPDIVEDWTMTSDGLAAWLAHRIEAAHVALIKSCDVPERTTLDNLKEAGIIDPQFALIVARTGLRWHVLSADDGPALAALLDIKV